MKRLIYCNRFLFWSTHTYSQNIAARRATDMYAIRTFSASL